MRSFVPDYDLVIAQNLPNALELLSAGDGWRPMAGGTDLMVLFNAGKLPYRKLFSIREVGELRRIEVTEQNVVIGAAVTYTEIRNSAVLHAEFPLLCEAASWTGSIANQNRGTLGGNIANASPAADSAPMLLVYEAELELVSRGGKRWTSYNDFHTGYKMMQLREDELITRIWLPRSLRHWASYARKVGTRKAQAISKICFAATADYSDNTIRDVRISVGSLAPVPLRCHQTEQSLRGSRCNPEAASRAQEAMLRDIQPITDIRSTREYRSQVTLNLLHDFLTGLR
jgi:CO/xanthine dehydrogenase FAD-binding subunit